MAIKQIQLNGEETAVHELRGYYAVITNLRGGDIYASLSPNISTTPEKAIAIPQGVGVCIALPLNAKTVYLLGTGTVSIEETDVIRNSINSASVYYVDTQITEAKHYAESMFNNTNLLLNPDFSINQRGQTQYDTAGYTVDGWKINDNINMSILENGEISLRLVNTSKGGEFYQPLEYSYSTLSGRTLTLSVMLLDGKIYTTTGEVSSNAYTQLTNISTMYIPIDGASYHIGLKYSTALKRFVVNVWIPASSGIEVVNNIKAIKLELGSVATPFIPPHPTIEIFKCQRYYQIHTTEDIAPTDLCPNMSNELEIGLRSDGFYEYMMEI